MRLSPHRTPERPPAVRRAEPFVLAAGQTAQRLGHGYVGTEHMLLVLAEVLPGLSVAEIEAEVVALAEPRPALDARALATLGIDLEEVRRRIEQTFGAGALDRAAQPCLPMAPELKRALALAVARAGEGPVRAEDMVDALRSTDCVAARILSARAA
jgi:hypothetical protein